MAVSPNADRGTLSVEIWSQVMDYCSVTTIKVLARVSYGCCSEARKRLYVDVQFRDGFQWDDWDDYDREHPNVTLVRDLKLVHRTLLTTNFWRYTIETAYFSWSNELRHAYDDPNDSRHPVPETEEHRQLDRLVQATSTLLSESTRLKILHLSPPRLRCTVPFSVPRLNSMHIPITGCMLDFPDWHGLFNLFQIPSLRYVGLKTMVRLNEDIPPELWQRGISNVTHVKFPTCGYVCEQILPLLLWPRDLQSVKFEVQMPPGRYRFAYDPYGSEGWEYGLPVLKSLKHTVQDIELNVDVDISVIVPGGMFRSFTKLRRLTIPMELLMEFSCLYTEGEGARYLEENGGVPPPIYVNLPSSLQVLTLTVASEVEFIHYDEDSNERTAGRSAHELFESLYEIPEKKAERFPELRELRIWLQDDLRMDCEYTRKFIQAFELKGIAIVFVFEFEDMKLAVERVGGHDARADCYRIIPLSGFSGREFRWLVEEYDRLTD